MSPDVTGFFDETTKTVSHLVADPATGMAAIVDPVLDFDPATGASATGPADLILEVVKRRRSTVQWLLETHVHADHLRSPARFRVSRGGLARPCAGPNSEPRPLRRMV